MREISESNIASDLAALEQYPALDADRRPWWVIPDSTGRLKGLLHVLRRAGFCRDVIVLIAASTPEAYRCYLTERDYRCHQLGERQVDLRRALSLLATAYGVQRVVTDCGPALNSALVRAAPRPRCAST